MAVSFPWQERDGTLKYLQTTSSARRKICHLVTCFKRFPRGSAAHFWERIKSPGTAQLLLPLLVQLQWTWSDRGQRMKREHTFTALLNCLTNPGEASHTPMPLAHSCRWKVAHGASLPAHLFPRTLSGAARLLPAIFVGAQKTTVT